MGKEYEIRRELENRTTVADPDGVRHWRGTVSEVADEIAQFVMELESGPARGVLAALLDWIQTYQQEAQWRRDGRDTATVRVRYRYANEGVQRWTVDVCDRHGTLTYEQYIREGKRNVEIMPAGWRWLMGKCTHGADCTVHPDENRLHNLDSLPVLDPGAIGESREVCEWVRGPLSCDRFEHEDETHHDPVEGGWEAP